MNARWLSALFCGDDAIDVDAGYAGSMQFVFIMTGRRGHLGLEADSNAQSRDVQPRTQPLSPALASFWLARGWHHAAGLKRWRGAACSGMRRRCARRDARDVRTHARDQFASER